MKNAKKVLLALLLVCVALFGGVLAACSKDTPPEPVAGPEAGVYKYYDTNTEYTLTLSKGNKFTLSMNGEKSGDYTIADATVTLKIAGGDLTGVLGGNVLTVTVNGDALKFYKVVDYTVTFSVDGGSAVSPVTAVNGKAIAAPADPTKANYIFVGWYTDATLKTRFDFSTVITGDLTLYARWVPVSATAQEFTVAFDLGYDGATAPAEQQTIGGKLYDVATPVRSGYTFCGWWISFTEDKTALSFRYADSYEFKANTTLFALWRSDSLGSKLADPLVNVEGNAVRWESVTGASNYTLQISGPDGFTAIEKTIPGTFESVDFAKAPAGDYTITVTANASDAANSATAVRYYKNKALDRVSLFRVEDDVLLFNDVGADSYSITVNCGNAQHNHTDFDLGKETRYDFGNCTMQPGGILFTVTAKADGKADSVSAPAYKVERNLAAVTGFAVDEDTQVLTFTAVENAAYYVATVNGTTVELGDKTSLSLKEYPAGNVAVTVIPYAKGYNSPAAANYTYAKKTLATPSNVRISGTTVSWDAVATATGYTVKVGDKEYPANGTSLDIGDKIDKTAGAACTISVRANGTNASLYSDVLTAKYQQLNDNLRYARNTLSWDFALGATGYEVKVNDGEVTAVAGDRNSTAVTLTKAGENTLQVRVTGSNTWVTLKVTAYSIAFDTSGGAETATVFAADGDTITLPTPTKTGYDFANWCTAAENGEVFADTTFRGSANMTLYAFYTAKEYTVTYNYGTGGNASDTSTKVWFKDNYTFAVPTPNTATKLFVGWFSEENGGGTQFTDEKGDSLAAWSIADDTTVYAFWADDALSYTKTTYNGREVYMVSKGARINLVTEVTIPEEYEGIKVAVVAANAFQDCPALVALNIPNTVEFITMVQTFDGCERLQAINVYEVEGNNSVRYWSDDGVLYDNGSLNGAQTDASLIQVPTAKTGSYTIPDGIKAIPARAFANSALTEVEIPATVTSIGASAFADSRNLETVTFTAGTADLTVGELAFKGCVSLQSITLPARLKSIDVTRYELAGNEIDLSAETAAFAGCTLLTEINVEENGTTYGSVDGMLASADGSVLYYVPEGKSFTAYTTPAGVQTVARGAFLGKGITQLTVSNTVTSIEECAFAANPLTKVTFAGNAFNPMTVGDYAFRDCAQLTQVEFQSGCNVAVLQSSVFYNCNRILSLDLPASVSQISQTAFDGCASLSMVNVDANNKNFVSESGTLFNKDKTVMYFFSLVSMEDGVVIWPETVAVIPANAFYRNKDINKIVIGPNVTEIGANAFNYSYLEEVEFTEGEGADSLIIGDYAFYGCDIGSIELPARTKTIGNYAFAEMSCLETLTLNEGLESIGEYAFDSSDEIESIHIPASVKTLGRGCFNDAGGYGVTVTFAENSQLTEIPQRAFAGMSIEEIEIPEGVKTIGYQAFYDCDLETVTIPGSVTAIGANAFEDCSYLDTVIFEPGTEDLVIGARVSYINWNGETSTAIGRSFDGCRYLKAIELPARTTVLEEQSFAGAGSYSAFVVTFAEGSRLTTIADYAFGGDNDDRDSSNLSEITIPKSVKNTSDRIAIGEGAFARCYDLTKVTFEGGGSDPLTLGTDAFYYCYNLTEIVLPDWLASYTDNSGKVYPMIGENALAECSALTAFELEEGATNFAVDDGVLYNGAKTQLILCPAGKEGTVTIPTAVTEIFDKAFYKCEKVTALDFGENTNDMTIGDYAFYNCRALVNVTLPQNVTELGAGAFADCYNLESITLSDKLQSYDGSTFDGSSKAVVIVPQTNPYIVTDDGALYGANKTVLIKYTGDATTFTVPNTVTVIEANAFNGNKTLTSIVIPEGVTTIGAQAFQSTALESVSIPGSVTFIGDYAFGSCSALTTVEFGAGTEDLTIGDYAFVNARELTGVELPVHLKAMGINVFYGCSELAQVTFKGTRLTALQEGVFHGTKIQSIELPAGIQTVGDRVFYNCSNLTTVKFGDGLKTIGDSLFYNCSELTSVEFPASLTTLGMKTFYNCSELKAFEIPAGVAEISDYWDFDYRRPTQDSPFYMSGIETVTFAQGGKVSKIGAAAFYKSNLKNITLPATVSTIGNYAFSETKLTSITIPNTVTVLGTDIFRDCDLLTSAIINAQLLELPGYLFASCDELDSVTIPATVMKIASSCFNNCPKMTAFVLAEGNKSFVVDDGILYNANKTELIAYPQGRSGTITIPKGVTIIGDSMFSNSKVEHVVFESGRTEPIDIDIYAFSYCEDLKTVVLPDAVGEIGYNAFYGCTALTDIDLGKTVADIGESAFSGCSNLSNVKMPTNLTYINRNMFNNCTSLTSITLPANLVTIGQNAFANTGLTSITLPASVSSIGTGAFTDSKLTAFVVEDGNTAFAEEGGILYNADKTTLLVCPSGKTGTVTIPKSVTTISDYAFSGSKVEHVVFESGRTALITLGQYAFRDCKELQSIVFPSSGTRIGRYAFSDCTKLETVTLPEAELYIASYAFSGCTAITTITIPSTLTATGSSETYIFRYWTADQTINFVGKSKEEIDTLWKASSYSWYSSWYTGCNATINYNVEAPAEE